jgi:hypothetical protein
MKCRDEPIPVFRQGRARYQVVVPDDADDWVMAAAHIIRRAIGAPEVQVVREAEANRRRASIRLVQALIHPNLVPKTFKPETSLRYLHAFRLRTERNRIELVSATGHGLINGARAFADLVYPKGAGLYVPSVTILDYPDLAYRGIYVECRWGPDMMSLDQWKEAIDHLAAMRMNVMSVGLYNNWPIQYDGRISEWMMVPIKRYPKLNTPKLVTYYSPSRKEDVRLEYVPRIYEEDLFGEIVKYGKSRGVIVRPHFNTPGHNTQIPRHYPQTSAKFPDGTPKKYGFCMSSPATFEIMLGIFDEICDRYLLPNGIDWFHIGLDEVYPSVGMNEDMPLKRIDPWCECPECVKTSPEDRFVNYAVRLAKHLKEKGINNIGMWHDHFARGGKMNEDLSRRFEEEGLMDSVVLHWWRYSDFFDTTMPELGFRRWVVPMTGYFYWINYQNHLANCFLAAEKGVEEHAEGTEAYGVWHPAYHQHFAILAAKSWNSDQWPDMHAFRAEYAKFLFGERWREGLRALNYFDDFTAGPGMVNFLSRLFDYPYLYAGWKEDAYIRENYPRPLIERMLANPLNITGFLGQIAGFAQKAIDIFSRDGLWADGMANGQWSMVNGQWTMASGSDYSSTMNHQPSTIPFRDLYVTECLRIKAVLDLFPKLVNGVRQFRDGADAGKLTEAADAIDKMVEQLDGAMLAIETHWEAPFVPQPLRELTLMRRFAVDLASELRSGPKGALKVMECRVIDWPNDP